MPNQENPSTHQLRVRVTEEVYRTLERLAARRGYPDVSSLVRAILAEYPPRLDFGTVARARNDALLAEARRILADEKEAAE